TFFNFIVLPFPENHIFAKIIPFYDIGKLSFKETHHDQTPLILVLFLICLFHTYNQNFPRLLLREKPPLVLPTPLDPPPLLPPLGGFGLRRFVTVLRINLSCRLSILERCPSWYVCAFVVMRGFIRNTMAPTMTPPMTKAISNCTDVLSKGLCVFNPGF